MRHLDLDLLQAVVDGELPPKTLLRRLLDHVGELCPECAAVVAALRQGGEVAAGETGLVTAVQPVTNGRAHPEVVSLPDPRLAGAFDRAQRGAAEWTKQIRRARRRARADLRELLRMPADERRHRVEQARSRFRSRALAELLVDESRRLVHQDAAEAQSMAALVEAVLLWTPGAIDEDWARELSLRAHACEANAWRVLGELRTADRMFTELRARLACEVSNSEELHAEVCSLEASLRLDQGRSHEARRLLVQAASLFEAAGDSQALGKVLMKQAVVERQQDDLQAALRVQQRSLELLDPLRDAKLYLQALTNLGFYLLGLGRIADAAALVSRHEAELALHDLWSTPTMCLLRGRIAVAAEDVVEAERLFLASRAGALQRGDTLRVALASLDLALLYLERGRTSELRQMAHWMGQVFASRHLHEEAMATVVLMQQAVAAETISAEALRAWRRHLEGSPRTSRARAPQAPS